MAWAAALSRTGKPAKRRPPPRHERIAPTRWPKQKTDEADVAALIESHATDAHHVPTEAGGGGTHEIVGGGVYDGHLEGPPVAMRIGWNQSRNMNAAVFTRANTHPIDGAAMGMTSGLAAPPFPPALASDPTLYLGLWLAGDSEVAVLPETIDAGSKRALSVNGTAGHYYTSSARLPASTSGSVYRVILQGPRILTADDLAGLGGGASPKWYYVALLRGNSAQPFVSGASRNFITSNTATADYYRSKWADYAALKADVDSKTVTQFAVQWIETDADGAASDEKNEVIPNNALFSTGANLDSFISFALGTSPGGVRINFGASTITGTPDFSYSGAGANGGLTIILGVWA